MFRCFRSFLYPAFITLFVAAASQHTIAKVVESDEFDTLPLIPDVIDLLKIDQPIATQSSSIARSPGEVHELFRKRGSPLVVLQYATTPKWQDGDLLHPYIIALANQLSDGKFELSEATSLDPPQQFYAALIKSLQARDSGQIDTAEQFAQEALENEPEHPFALNLLAQLRLLQQRYDEADQLLTWALKQAPGFAGAMANRAALAYTRGNYIEAVDLYDRALAREPYLCAAILGRSAALLRLGNLAQSSQNLKRCADVPGFDFNANLLRVGLALAQRDYEQAEELAHWFKNTAPDTAHYWLAEIAMHRGEPGTARAHLDSIELDSPRAQYLSALANAAVGNYSAAILGVQELQKEVQANPDVDFSLAVFQFANEGTAPEHTYEALPIQNDARYALLHACRALARADVAEAAEFWRESSGMIAGFDVTGMSVAGLRHPLTANGARDLALAALFYDTGYNKISRHLLGEVLDSSPDMPAALLLTSIVATSMNDSDFAASTVDQLLDLEPRLFSALYQASELNLKNGNYTRARIMLARAVAEKPDRGALLKLALLEDREGNLSNAVTAMKTYIASYPSDFVGYNQLAWLYAKREQNLDHAMDLALTANRLQAQNVSVLDTIGWIHFLQGDLDKAADYLESANELASGNHPDVLFHLASIAAERGETAEAGRLLKKALQLSMPFDSRDAARQLLAALDME